MNNKEINIEDLVSKWINGDLSPEDEVTMKSHPDFEYYNNLLTYVDDLSAPSYNIDSAWKKVKNAHSQSENAEVKISPPEAKVVRFNRKVWLGLAAACLTGILFVSIFLLNGNESISTAIAQQEAIVLPDGSKVVLNATSELAWNKKFTGDREVELKGEAYFEVEKGFTFKVLTNQGEVQVLGTKFNVYNTNEGITVKCFEGRVQVNARGKESILEAREGVEINKNGELSNIKLNTDAPSWKAGVTTFENKNLKEVFSELERYFAIKVEFKGDGKRNITGRFTHTNLKDALVMICKPMKLEYLIEDNGKVVIEEIK